MTVAAVATAAIVAASAVVVNVKLFHEMAREGLEQLGWLAGRPDRRVQIVQLGAPLQRWLFAHQAKIAVPNRLELAVPARTMDATLLLRSLQANER